MQVQLSEQLHCSLDYLIKGQEYETIETTLPSFTIEIIRSKNEHEISLLLDYLNFFDRLHNNK
jgi:hypothetical protein